jgi:hypothetical protein
MAGSPYRTLADILRADVTILDALLTVHTVRHCGAGDCPANGGCETQEELRQTFDSVSRRLEREIAKGEAG